MGSGYLDRGRRGHGSGERPALARPRALLRLARTLRCTARLSREIGGSLFRWRIRHRRRRGPRGGRGCGGPLFGWLGKLERAGRWRRQTCRWATDREVQSQCGLSFCCCFWPLGWGTI